MIAIYGLILYLYNFKDDIAHYKPFWKFFSIKIALFLSIWQTKLLSWFDVKSIVELVHRKDKDVTSADYIDDCLLTFEMFFLAVVATHTFSYDNFHRGFTQNDRKVFLRIPKILFGSLKDTYKDITSSEVYSHSDIAEVRKPSQKDSILDSALKPKNNLGVPKGSVVSYTHTLESSRRARKLSDDELARKSSSLFQDQDQFDIPNR